MVKDKMSLKRILEKCVMKIKNKKAKCFGQHSPILEAENSKLQSICHGGSYSYVVISEKYPNMLL